jgi:hypothetical protein
LKLHILFFNVSPVFLISVFAVIMFQCIIMFLSVGKNLIELTEFFIIEIRFVTNEFGYSAIYCGRSLLVRRSTAVSICQWVRNCRASSMDPAYLSYLQQTGWSRVRDAMMRMHFFLLTNPPSHTRAWVYPASNRNNYQKRGRRVRLSTTPSSVSHLSRQREILNVSTL